MSVLEIQSQISAGALNLMKHSWTQQWEQLAFYHAASAFDLFHFWPASPALTFL